MLESLRLKEGISWVRRVYILIGSAPVKIRSNSISQASGNAAQGDSTLNAGCGRGLANFQTRGFCTASCAHAVSSEHSKGCTEVRYPEAVVGRHPLLAGSGCTFRSP